MKKFLVVAAIVGMISGSLNAGVKCNDGCLQAHFQQPGKDTCTDIYRQCCSAWTYKQPHYAKCTATCSTGYHKSNPNAEKDFNACEKRCESKYRKALELPSLKCAA